MGKLIRLPVPANIATSKEAGWLVVGFNCTQLEYDIVIRSADDDGIVETPLGSNRGVRIDRWVRWAGLEPPVYWCAIAVGVWFASKGVPLPVGFPSCDAWLPYMSKEPRPGAAILYGRPGDARHIEIVTRCDEYITLTRGGNRGYHGSKTNNGVAVDQAPQIRTDVLGFVYPETLIQARP